MRNKTLAFVGTLLILGMLVAGFLVQSQGAARAQADMSCTLHDFVAAVRSGPNAGWTVAGDLNLTIATDGSVSGTVTSAADASTLATVVGQITGHAVNLAFDLGKAADTAANGEHEYYMYGSGTMVNAPSDCAGPMGGVFAGPQPGDIGDWDICTDYRRPGTPPPIPCDPNTPQQPPPSLPPLLPPIKK